MYIRYIAEVEPNQPRSKTMKTKGGTLLFPSGTRAPSLSQMTCENATADTKCAGRLLSLLSARAHTHTHTSVLLSSREFVSHERSHDFRALVLRCLSPSWPGLDREKRKRNASRVPRSRPLFLLDHVCCEYWISLGGRIENFHWDSRIRERNLIESDLILYGLDYLCIYILDEN